MHESPVRRRAITPHTIASVWPLEPGEAVELVNESGGPATVHVHAGCLASAGAVPGRWHDEAERLRAEVDRLRKAAEAAIHNEAEIQKHLCCRIEAADWAHAELARVSAEVCRIRAERVFTSESPERTEYRVVAI